MTKNFCIVLSFLFLLHSTWTQPASNKPGGRLLEGGYKCKTCKRVVMSLQTFLKSEESKTKGMGMLEESLQSEFERLCTYSNVFFEKTFRKSVSRILCFPKVLEILIYIRAV